MAKLRFRVRFPLLRWSAVDKCLLVSAILWIAAALFAALTTFADGWPYLPAALPDELRAEVARSSWWVVLAWSLLLALGWTLRRRRPDSRVLVYVVVHMYSFITAQFTYITGPFNAAGWIAFIGGAIVGFLLFERRVVFTGMATWLITIVATAYLAEIDVLPLAPLVRATGGEVSVAWLLRNSVMAAALAALILPLCSAIITSWRGYEQRLEELSRTDGLTGVANRRHVLEILDHELRQARRYGRHLSILMVDLDHFKRINDDHGHQMGDRVLEAAARALGASVRDTDVVGRYGGEEFLIVLPNTDLQGAREVAERCRESVAEARINTLAVTASLGIATFPSEAASVDDLVHDADEAMYRAKQSGRDRIAAAVY